MRGPTGSPVSGLHPALVASGLVFALAGLMFVAAANTSQGTDLRAERATELRDLVRQIPAEWQENVKHRAGLSYGDFLTRIQDPERASRIASAHSWWKNWHTPCPTSWA